MYGCESWVWREKNENAINTVKMRSLRCTCMMSLQDMYRNSDFRERCGLKENIVTRVEKEVPAVTKERVLVDEVAGCGLCTKLEVDARYCNETGARFAVRDAHEIGGGGDRNSEFAETQRNDVRGRVRRARGGPNTPRGRRRRLAHSHDPPPPALCRRAERKRSDERLKVKFTNAPGPLREEPIRKRQNVSNFLSNVPLSILRFHLLLPRRTPSAAGRTGVGKRPLCQQTGRFESRKRRLFYYPAGDDGTRSTRRNVAFRLFRATTPLESRIARIAKLATLENWPLSVTRLDPSPSFAAGLRARAPRPSRTDNVCAPKNANEIKQRRATIRLIDRRLPTCRHWPGINYDGLLKRTDSRDSARTRTVFTISTPSETQEKTDRSRPDRVSSIFVCPFEGRVTELRGGTIARVRRPATRAPPPRAASRPPAAPPPAAVAFP
ncbi:hypothetical protein EVAR_58482_1 [Eumeta japonica]|uniref:Uncharacterized protein n=1 Tax=Eumeta variegata TaxID=151549 RepID=A0A4C1YKV8_EUMVA|nr:hypothetical protein EVAR_58482_1 [Eumeta japonica]